MDELHADRAARRTKDESGGNDVALPRRLSWTRVVAAAVPLAIATAAAIWVFDDPLPPTDSRSRIGKQGAAHPPRRPSPFDLSGAIVPATEIRSGGPPIDGIPALSQPELVSADLAAYLAAADRVVGVELGGQARAYPLKILNFHEIVNDSIVDRAVAVTYCPLCDSVAVIDRDQTLEGRELGVSGLLYNSNVLMYDRDVETPSLWSQLLGKAIAGPRVESPLVYLPATLTTWEAWKARYPDTTVLSAKTGHVREYSHNPYAVYFQSDRPMFPVAPTSDQLPPRMRVVGVWSDQTYRAYPESLFDHKGGELIDEIDGRPIKIRHVPNEGIDVVHAAPELQWVYAFWFAWYAMHPETEVAE